MKYKFTPETKRKMLSYCLIAAISITIYFMFEHFKVIKDTFNQIISLMMPFILGFAFAFLLNKPMMFIEEKILGRTSFKQQTKRNIAAIIAVILGIFVVVFFVGLLVPQIIDSIMSLVSSFPGYWKDFQVVAYDFMDQYALHPDELTKYLTDVGLVDKVSNVVSNMIPMMAKYTYQFASGLLNVLLGIMSALYMLMDKERLLRYSKKLNYALFPSGVSTYIHRVMVSSVDIFNDFIVGKAIDSLIIGILCYIGCLVFNFPYALLLSVFVGVTNMIPVFGPFIGAIPGVFILLIINPITSLYFAIFIFALQQFDGNILGPLILGDKLGLPTIGILFAVCIGGGLFGVVGMFIGVPAFAVFYMMVKEFVDYRLEKKQLGVEDLHYDVENHAPLEDETFHL